MYQSYYGFNIKPFQIVPNPDVIYLSPKYQNALTYMEYGLMEMTGFILLTGEVGSGKTTLVKHLLKEVGPHFEVAAIFNTNVSPEELIHMILADLEVGPVEGSKADALDLLYMHLIECYSRNKRVLIVIDEVQNLSREALEEVRMLSNLQSDEHILLQVILVGQPEIRERLKAKDMVQLKQRISVAFHLPALTREETGEYIAYRLEKAGGKADIFTQEAVELIFNASGGIPRVINILCDSALVYGFADELPTIDAALVEQVLIDRDGMGLGLDTPSGETPDLSGTAADGRWDTSRLDAIEDALARLQAQVNEQLGALEKAESAREELVQLLKGLYDLEKEKNSRLMYQYSSLNEKYLARQEALGDGRERGPGSNGGYEELMAAMKDAVVQLSVENRMLKDQYDKVFDVYQNLMAEKHKGNRLLKLFSNKKDE